MRSAAKLVLLLCGAAKEQQMKSPRKPQTTSKQRMNARRHYLITRGHTVVVDASAHVRCERCGAYFWLDTFNEVPLCAGNHKEHDNADLC